jgi:hypothetical protein
MTTNKIYRSVGTAVRFKDTDATYTITLNNLAATTGGRVSDVWDRGDAHLPVRYRWRACIQFETAPVVGEYVEIYKFASDGTAADGVVGASDAALTAAQASNGKLMGIVKVQTTDAAVNFIASGITEIWDRYVSVGMLNKTADNLKATNDTSWIELTPMIDEIEAAA